MGGLQGLVNDKDNATTTKAVVRQSRKRRPGINNMLMYYKQELLLVHQVAQLITLHKSKMAVKSALCYDVFCGQRFVIFFVFFFGFFFGRLSSIDKVA